MSASRLALVSVLLLAGLGLASPAQGVVHEDHQRPAVTVHVENRAATDAHVYVLQQGHMVPIGFVEAGESATLTAPWAAVESDPEIRLVADAVTSSEWFQSEAVGVEPDDEVDFLIARDLDGSSVSVRD